MKSFSGPALAKPRARHSNVSLKLFVRTIASCSHKRALFGSQSIPKRASRFASRPKSANVSRPDRWGEARSASSREPIDSRSQLRNVEGFREQDVDIHAGVCFTNFRREMGRSHDDLALDPALSYRAD